MVKPRSQVSELEKEEMKQVLSFSDVFAVGYGDLGSSIYYALGVTALYALGATPIALMIAGFVFACTALTYAEMTSMTIAAGGSANFTRYAMNDLISFIASWALLLDFIVTIAISAASVAPYLSFFFPKLELVEYQVGLTVVLIFSLYLLNVFSSKHSTRLSWILTGLTLATQGVIIIIGVIFLSKPHAFIDHLRINGPDHLFSPTWNGFWKGTAMAMVAYTGIESMAQLTSETKNPRKTVPRAIMCAMVVLILMYFAISFVALSAVTPEELSTTYLKNPISGIVAALPFGAKILGPWVGLLGATLLLVAANAGLLGASRLAFRMGTFYQLPSGFYTLHKRFNTPYKSLAFFACLAIFIVLASRGKLDFLADLYNFGAMLAFFFAHLALIILRFKMPSQERPFRVPFNIKCLKGISIPLPSIIGCLATCGVWLMLIFTKPEGRNLGLAWLAIGIPIYLLYRKKKKIDLIKELKIEKIKIPGFKKFNFSHILVAIQHDQDVETIQIACKIAKYNKAALSAVHIIEIPLSVSIYADLQEVEMNNKSYLKQSEAISREYGLDIDLTLIKTRSIAQTLLDVIYAKKCDLLILGSSPINDNQEEVLDEIRKFSSCHILLSRSKGH